MIFYRGFVTLFVIMCAFVFDAVLGGTPLSQKESLAFIGTSAVFAIMSAVWVSK